MHAIAELACVASGGAIGAVVRHLASGTFARFVGVPSWIAIIGVNILGSLLAGMLVGWLDPLDGLVARAFLLIGICGGLTTFSTAMLDAWVLLATRRRGLGWFCLLGTPALSVAGAWLGYVIGSLA